MKKLIAFLLILVLCVSACAYGEETWTCPNCGQESTGNFCSNCGTPKPEEWVCPNCGTAAKGNFCSNCGTENPSTVKVGDIVTFGTWAGEPIEWQVLEVKEDGSCILLSVKGLDARPYNTKYTDVTWETCTIREWLNSEFYENAFSASEKGKIVFSTVENPDNKFYGTKGGKTTQDYVYLLSLDEEKRYFASGNARICYATAYAKKNGAWTNDAGACWWWLRSPGDVQDSAASVGSAGNVYTYGYGVHVADACVRPVVCARL